jgi:hypothetical protein
MSTIGDYVDTAFNKAEARDNAIVAAAVGKLVARVVKADKALSEAAIEVRAAEAALDSIKRDGVWARVRDQIHSDAVLVEFLDSEDKRVADVTVSGLETKGPATAQYISGNALMGSVTQAKLAELKELYRAKP